MAIKASVVVTVFNEAETVSQLLDSLLAQTNKPDEIVIVDGGSTDGTKKALKSYQNKHEQIKLFIKEGNISVGRNFAIKKAKNGIVVQTDAGCIAKRDWLQKITAPFEDESVGLVAGYYYMTAETAFSRALAPFMGVPSAWYDRHTFLPSGRSVAFKKSVWKKVGGYDEALTSAGEDTQFNHQIVKNEIKINRAPEAIVYWRVPDSLKSAAYKFYSYAKGDGQNGIWWHPTQKLKTHNIKILSIFLRYFVFVLLLGYPTLFIAIFVGYLGWSTVKMRSVVKDTQARLYVPLIQVASDICVMTGFISGILKK